MCKYPHTRVGVRVKVRVSVKVRVKPPDQPCPGIPGISHAKSPTRAYSMLGSPLGSLGSGLPRVPGTLGSGYILGDVCSMPASRSLLGHTIRVRVRELTELRVSIRIKVSRF